MKPNAGARRRSRTLRSVAEGARWQNECRIAVLATEALIVIVMPGSHPDVAVFLPSAVVP